MIRISSLHSLENISDTYCVDEDYRIINTKTAAEKKQTRGKRGYLYVSLNEKRTNRQVKVPVHKIIALAFINNGAYECINHIDGNKCNNAPDNLEFCSQKQNVIHSWKHGLTVRSERIFQIIMKNGLHHIGTIKDLSSRLNIPKGTLYDLFYKGKESALYGIDRIEVVRDEGQETIEKVTCA